jgi:hypothetical protein
MCWKNIEEQCNTIYESKFIHIDKPIERKIMIQLIAEEFPEIPRMRIAATVDRSINHLQNPISRSAFIYFMQTSLS